MQVKVTYIDNSSIAPDDIKAHTKALYGESAKVEVFPDSDDPYSVMYFAIQKLITIRQVHSFFDDDILYPEKIGDLRKEVISLVGEAFTDVVKDNEEKLT